jgi:hypothetical protein
MIEEINPMHPVDELELPDALHDLNDEVEDNQFDDDYDYDEEDEICIEEPIEKPSREACIFLRESLPRIFKGEPDHVSKDHYYCDFLNIEDYLFNWDRLPDSMRHELSLIIAADWDNRNTATDGVKRPKRFMGRCNPNEKLAKHLLLLCGLQLRNSGYPYCNVIASNILQPDGLRNPNRTDQWWIDPRGAVTCIRNFHDNYNLEELMANNSAKILLFEGPEALRYVGEHTFVNAEYYKMLFSKNEHVLVRWQRKSFIQAYLIVHDISVFSIQDSTFRPHSHAVIWFNPASDLQFLGRLKRNSTIMRTTDRIYRRWDQIRNFISYLFKVPRIVETYEREFQDLAPDEVFNFNLKASHALIKLRELWKNTVTPKRRFTHGGLPMAID